MRIAYVTETWHPSLDGVVTRLEATLHELREMGHEALVVGPSGAPDAPGQTPAVRAPSFGVRFIADGKPWGLPTPRVTRAIADFGPDLIHVVHPFLLGLSGVRYARRHGVPLVASFHQDVADVARFYHLGWLRSVIWAQTRRLHAAAGANLVTSRAAAANVSAHGIANPRIWPAGVDVSLFDPARRSRAARERLTRGRRADVVALYVGRLAPEKGLERLAGVPEHPGVHLSLVGQGPLRQSLEATLDPSTTTFVGPLSGVELAEAYASADVFVFPSVVETFGFVLLEALASGLPVVAVETATSQEVLSDATGSRLCPIGSLSQLPAMVAEVGAPGAEWDTRSSKSRQVAESRQWSSATEWLVDTYEAVIAGGRRDARAAS